MAQVDNITLTNILAETTKPYTSLDTKSIVKVMARAPFVNYLRTQKAIVNTDTFSTGTNIFDQTIAGASEGATLEVSVSNEFMKQPKNTSWNFVTLDKKLILQKNQLAFLEKAYTKFGNQSVNAKKVTSYLTRNITMLREQYFPRHFQQHFADVENRIFRSSFGSAGEAGYYASTNFYGLHKVVSPTAGPNTSFGDGSIDLTDLDVRYDRPLYVTPAGGTGTTNLGPALTGSASIDLA